MAGVAIGAVHLSFHDAWKASLRKGAGVALAVVGLFAIINYVLTPKVELAWLRAEPEATQLARANGRPLVVDFMADWCLPCKEMDVQVFSHPDVVDELAAFTLLRVDLTPRGRRPVAGGGQGEVRRQHAAGGAHRLAAKVSIVQRFDTIVDAPTFLKGLARR